MSDEWNVIVSYQGGIILVASDINRVRTINIQVRTKRSINEKRVGEYGKSKSQEIIRIMLILFKWCITVYNWSEYDVHWLYCKLYDSIDISKYFAI